MKYYTTIFVFFGLLAAFPSIGQTSLLIGRSNTYFDFVTGAAYSGDSAIISYNGLRQPNEYKNWRIDATGDWYMSSRSTDYTYDANGNLLHYLFQDGNDVLGWTNAERYTYTYDGNDHELSNIVEKWNGANWITQSENHKVYDANGRLLSSTGSNSRTLYTYDTQGLLETKIYQGSPSGNWVNVTRYEYTYLPNDTLYASETAYDWQANAWKESSRTSDTYDTNGHLIQSLVELWNGTSWQNSLLFSSTYDAEGYLIQTLTQLWNSSAWENSTLYTISYDAAHNLIFWSYQSWVAGDWEGFFRQYNGFDAKSNFIYGRLEYWDGVFWFMESFGRLNYLEVVASQNPVLANFEIFPNPASTSVTLSGTGLSRAMLFDQQGRLVCVQNLQGQDQETLQVGNLPTGNYSLQVLGLDGSMGAKPLQIRR